MTGVRRTPKRRRRPCPTCGRETAYTYPFRGTADPGLSTLRKFARHNNPTTGERCPEARGW